MSPYQDFCENTFTRMKTGDFQERSSRFTGRLAARAPCTTRSSACSHSEAATRVDLAYLLAPQDEVSREIIDDGPSLSAGGFCTSMAQAEGVRWRPEPSQVSMTMVALVIASRRSGSNPTSWNARAAFSRSGLGNRRMKAPKASPCSKYLQEHFPSVSTHLAAGWYWSRQSTPWIRAKPCWLGGRPCSTPPPVQKIRAR